MLPAPPSGIVEVLHNLLMSVVDNPINALVNANYVGILTWAILAGLALHKASANTKATVNDLATAITKIVQWVIRFAPFGIMGLVANAIALVVFNLYMVIFIFYLYFLVLFSLLL